MNQPRRRFIWVGLPHTSQSGPLPRRADGASEATSCSFLQPTHLHTHDHTSRAPVVAKACTTNPAFLAVFCIR